MRTYLYNIRIIHIMYRCARVPATYYRRAAVAAATATYPPEKKDKIFVKFECENMLRTVMGIRHTVARQRHPFVAFNSDQSLCNRRIRAYLNVCTTIIIIVKISLEWRKWWWTRRRYVCVMMMRVDEYTAIIAGLHATILTTISYEQRSFNQFKQRAGLNYKGCEKEKKWVMAEKCRTCFGYT